MIIYICLLVLMASLGFLAGVFVERRYYEEPPNPAKFIERGSD